jgi:hypothetical protein
MRLTTDQFRAFLTTDPDDDGDQPFGDALEALVVDIEADSVEAVRDVRARP